MSIAISAPAQETPHYDLAAVRNGRERRLCVLRKLSTLTGIQLLSHLVHSGHQLL